MDSTFSIQICEEFGVRKIVFSSSSCIYGNPEYFPIDENHPVGAGITNPYGRSKYFTEEIIKDLCISNKVNNQGYFSESLKGEKWNDHF